MKFLTPDLLRLTANLERAPLTDVLAAASMTIESIRELLQGLNRMAGGNAADSELIDRNLKPIIRELVRRQIELETYPPGESRGNA